MHLNEFNAAWEQIKMANAMQPINSREILSIIDDPQNTGKSKIVRVLLNIAMFIFITIICQGG